MDKNLTEKEEKRKKAILAVSKDPYRLVKGNPLINASFDITAIQFKILLHMISKVDMALDDFQPITILITEFQRFAKVNTKAIYNLIETQAEKLRSKSIYYEDDEIKLSMSLLSSWKYHKKKGAYTFRFDPELKPFLLDLKENFTVYDIRNIMQLDSAYSIRFFEFCKQYEDLGQFEMSVEAIRKTFKIEHKYKNYFDFKKNVIEQAIKELKTNSELYFDIDKEIKDSRKVVAIRFKIVKNRRKFIRDGLIDVTPQELELKTAIAPQSQSIMLVVYESIKAFISLETVQKWFDTYPESQITAAVSYSLEQHKKGKVKEIASYLQKMVATQTITEQEEKKRKVKEESQTKQKIVKAKIDQEQKLKITNEQLKAQYYKIEQDFTISKITSEPYSLCEAIMEYLALKKQKGDFLSELSLESFDVNTIYSHNSKEEFIYNVEKGGTFAASAINYVKDKFKKEFEVIRLQFEAKATAQY